MKTNFLLTVIMMLIASTQAAAQKFPQEFSAQRRASIETIATTNHPDRLYRIGDTAKVEIVALNHGLPLEAEVSYRTGPEMLLPNEWQKAPLKSGRLEIDMGTMTEPGFMAVEWSFSVDGRTYKDLLKVGFAPDKIKTYARMPSDFFDFWTKAVVEARKTALEPDVWDAPEWTNDQIETKLVRLHVGKEKWMYGYLTRPRDGKPHPVVLCLPGAGSKKVEPADYYAQRGYIYLKMEIHGNDPRLSDAEYETMRKQKCEGYVKQGIENRDTYYYKDVYAGVVRCMDYLCSLPDWDGLNAFVTGGSQGGALTVVTAALSDKVTALVSFYPALNDLTGFLHGRAGGWPKFFTTLYNDGNLKDFRREKAEQTLQYYDVTNFARMLTLPGFYSYGYNDDTCSPTSICGMLNEIKAPKIIDITPSSGHWRFTESQNRAVEWMQSVQCKKTER